MPGLHGSRCAEYSITETILTPDMYKNHIPGKESMAHEHGHAPELRILFEIHTVQRICSADTYVKTD
jgi:hypothetical protein